MNRSALVGIFTIIGLAAIFALALVLANTGTGGRYAIGVHFKSAAGLHKGALVYESGVVVGSVLKSELLPDYTVLVTLSVNKGVAVPRRSRFLIQAPLTGDSTVEIVPPIGEIGAAPATVSTAAPEAVPTIRPDDLSDPANIAEGSNPATIQDLLDQGQGEVRRLDAMLAQLEKSEPRLIATLQTTLDNANALTRDSNAQLDRLANQVSAITTSLQGTIQSASGDVLALTHGLNDTLVTDRPRIDALLVSLDSSAKSLNATVDQVRALAADPRVHDNLIETTRGLAQTTVGFAKIVDDIHGLTSNQQTQGQLRDTVANIDASAQKINSLLGSFGGTSSVYGVDRSATPAPGAPPAGGSGGGSAIPGGTLPAGGPTSSPRVLKRDFSSLIANLAAVQVRLSEMSKGKSSGARSAAIAPDQGPVSDLNLVVLPRGRTSAVIGGNDLGGTSTLNSYLQQTVPGGGYYGFGMLYSRLGVVGGFGAKTGLGIEGRAYDPRRPTFDGYVTVQPRPGLQLFGGERDLTRDTRRTVFGLQLQF